MSYLRLRESGRHLFPPAHTIRSIKLYHRQIYAYAVHRSKLELLRRGELDEKHRGDTRFAPLANFLEAVPLICPHDLFRAEERGRAPQAHPEFADVARIIVNRKENAATHIAGLIIPSVGNNKLRHERLQRFMRHQRHRSTRGIRQSLAGGIPTAMRTKSRSMGATGVAGS